VQLYKEEKKKKLERIVEVGEVLRSETNKAKHLSVDKHSTCCSHQKTGQGMTESPPLGNRTKLVSVDLSDESSSSIATLDDGTGTSCSAMDVGANVVEMVSSAAELQFVSDYKTSVLSAKKAFAKNWVVMQAAEFELKAIALDCRLAQEDVDVLGDRDTFVRLTITGGDSPGGGEGGELDEAQRRLLQLAEELKAVVSAENFYRELRKRPKEEFNDTVLINDIVSNIDILIKEVVKQRKDIEKQVRHFKGVRIKTRIMNRPIPRLLLGAVRRKSDAGTHPGGMSLPEDRGREENNS
jgi:hypothetical protein